jgi:hypothetical protein
VTKRQLFFDPRANQPSEIGLRLLQLIAEDARKRGLALAIRALADVASDGANADVMARQRADAVADYLAQHAAVPVISIGLLSPSGAVSEPYRRIVRIDLLEPCGAGAKPAGAAQPGRKPDNVERKIARTPVPCRAGGTPPRTARLPPGRRAIRLYGNCANSPGA